MVSLITKNIAEDSWSNTRNSIKATDRYLTVRQTPPVLRQIDEVVGIEAHSELGRIGSAVVKIGCHVKCS